MTLLSLASRQIWPQVLAVAHFKPQSLILLHSDNHPESRGPAQRLKRFFDHTGLVSKGETKLELVPHDDFSSIERRLDEVASRHHLDLAQSVLHFTGGNKLMATAAFRWASRHGLQSFYLERGLQLTQFESRHGELLTSITAMDGHLTDHLDPVSLIRCQLDASEIERHGETITLSPKGHALADAELFKRIQSGHDPMPFLQITNPLPELPKEGDPLELAAAAVLLKLGVHQIQRGLRLKVRSVQQISSRLPHAEIDLLFTWGGRLWLVDCKDRMPAEDLVTNLRRCLPRSLPPDAEELLKRIKSELSIGQTKVMKEDLLAVRETGGLLGNVVCIRKAELPDQVMQYARHNQVQVVLKKDLTDGLRLLVHAPQPPLAT